MDIHQAIEARRSRRGYLPEPLKADDAYAIKAMVADQARQGDCRMELVVENGEAFAHFRRTYGMQTGVRNYVGMIARQDDRLSCERLGYFGEIVTLFATSRGLGTCWVGGSFDRSACPFSLVGDEQIVCVVIVGPVAPDESARERLIRGTMHRRSKTIEQMCDADAKVPAWFMAGMEAVQRAPSALNRQPVTFHYKAGKVTAGVQWSKDMTYLVDLGIAKLHFTAGAGGGTWRWGTGGEFDHDPAARLNPWG